MLLYKDYRVKTKEKIEFDYGDEKIYLTPHKFHIMFLKHCHNRGDFVILWSKNGVSWAEQVAKKLGLTKYIDLCMSKPSRHVDDKQTINEIVGDRIFIDEHD
jgi:hypothetical protein